MGLFKELRTMRQDWRNLGDPAATPELKMPPKGTLAELKPREGETAQQYAKRLGRG